MHYEFEVRWRLGFRFSDLESGLRVCDVGLRASGERGLGFRDWAFKAQNVRDFEAWHCMQSKQSARLALWESHVLVLMSLLCLLRFTHKWPFIPF